MELLIGLIIFVLVLVALAIASVRWGVNSRNPFTNGDGYDPRYDWQPRN
jgi:hypothetical protein